MTVVVPQLESPSHLASLGVSSEQLARVLGGCLAAYRSCTAFDAPTRRLTEVYFEAVRLLREELVPAGWEWDNADQQPRVFHRGRGVAIVFASGDANTGKPFPHAKTRRAKGEATQLKIATNQQLALDFTGTDDAHTTQDLITYVLLVAVVGEDLVAELSIPAAMDASGHVDTWTTRVLLEPMKTTSVPVSSPEQHSGPVFDVAVQRRS